MEAELTRRKHIPNLMQCCRYSMRELRAGCVLGSFLEIEDGLSYQIVIHVNWMVQFSL
jgi:hypothetical protein